VLLKEAEHGGRIKAEEDDFASPEHLFGGSEALVDNAGGQGRTEGFFVPVAGQKTPGRSGAAFPSGHGDGPSHEAKPRDAYGTFFNGLHIVFPF
jgi:hypothetical protein